MREKTENKTKRKVGQKKTETGKNKDSLERLTPPKKKHGLVWKNRDRVERKNGYRLDKTVTELGKTENWWKKKVSKEKWCQGRGKQIREEERRLKTKTKTKQKKGDQKGKMDRVWKEKMETQRKEKKIVDRYKIRRQTEKKEKIKRSKEKARKLGEKKKRRQVKKKKWTQGEEWKNGDRVERKKKLSHGGLNGKFT